MQKVEKNYRFAAAVRDENITYFSNIEYNGLYAWEDSEEHPVFLGFFPEEHKLKMMLHKQCLRVGDDLLFIPENSRYIHVYSLLTKQFLIVSEKQEEGIVKKYSEALMIDKIVLIFPINVSEPIKVINTNTWEVVNNIYITTHIENEFAGKKISRLSVDGEIVYISLLGEKRVICFNWATKSSEIINIGTNNNFGIYKDNHGFWSISMNENDISCYLNDGKEIRLELPYENIKGRYFNNMVTYGNKSVFIPAFCHFFVIYNNDNNKSIIIEDNCHSEINQTVPRYFKYDIKDGILTLYPFNRNAWVKVNLIDDTIDVKNVPLDVYDFNVLPYSEMYKDSLINEGRMNKLEEFLVYVASKN